MVSSQSFGAKSFDGISCTWPPPRLLNKVFETISSVFIAQNQSQVFILPKTNQEVGRNIWFIFFAAAASLQSSISLWSWNEPIFLALSLLRVVTAELKPVPLVDIRASALFLHYIFITSPSSRTSLERCYCRWVEINFEPFGPFISLRLLENMFKLVLGSCLVDQTIGPGL